LVGFDVDSPELAPNNSADEVGVTDVLHVLQGGIATIRKHPGGDPRMRLESFLADFVSSLVSNEEKSGVETYYSVPHFPRGIHAR
jgi:hypothetical protein